MSQLLSYIAMESNSVLMPVKRRAISAQHTLAIDCDRHTCTVAFIPCEKEVGRKRGEGGRKERIYRVITKKVSFGIILSLIRTVQEMTFIGSMTCGMWVPLSVNNLMEIAVYICAF